MTKNNYEVDILVNGKPVKEYLHDGKLYIEGRPGQSFSLRIRNNSWKKVLAVPSIDGLSVMDGKKASMHSSRGYIIQANDSVTIDGWRTSDKKVAQFYFSTPEDSYAERTEGGENLGVIGVAIFEQELPNDYWQHTGSAGGGGAGITNVYPNSLHGQPWMENTMSSNSAGVVGGAVGSIDSLKASANAGSMMLNTSENKVYALNESTRSFTKQAIGTGFGGEKRSEIIRTHFGRKSTPEAVIEIRYNTRVELEKLGINLNTRVVYVTPEAFPGDYCKPPVR